MMLECEKSDGWKKEDIGRCMWEQKSIVYGSFYFFKQETEYKIMPRLVGSEIVIRDS